MSANKLHRTLKEKASPVPAHRPAALDSLLREKAVLVRWTTGRWYGRGADEEVVQEVARKHHAQGDVGTFTKRFMDRRHLAGIDAVVNEARREHKRTTLAWSDRIRILSSAEFFDWKRKMTAYQNKFYEEVEKFLRIYESAVLAEKERLGGLWKERDYPSLPAMRKRFKFELAVFPIPSAEDFRIDLGAEEVTRIREDLHRELEQSVREATRDVWGRVQELVGKLHERLVTSEPEGIKSPLFDNLRELVEALPALNITGDPELSALGERIKKELLPAGGAEEVREDPEVRKQLTKSADGLLNIMSSYIGNLDN